MPESRKRQKKAREAPAPVYKNPLKKRWGQIVILLLVLGFVIGTIAGTIFLMIEYMRS